MAIIYKITNTINGMIYIGKTIRTLQRRKTAHKTTAKNGSKTYLHRAMRKYGFDNFQFEVIEECIEDNINESEISWIVSENSLVPTGYNMTEGGDGGDTSDSENFKRSMKNKKSVAGKNNPMYGKDSAMKGKKHKESTIEKMSVKRKEFWTEEKRDEASVKLSGENNPMYGKIPKNAIPLEIDGIIYNSIAHACRELKIPFKKAKRICKK